MFFCPSCKCSLAYNNHFNKSLLCSNSNCKLYHTPFIQVNNIPVLLPFGFNECIFKQSDFLQLRGKHSSKKNFHFKYL